MMAMSRKIHGAAGSFDIDLPLIGPPGIECRTGGATNDYVIVAAFDSGVAVQGKRQAQVVSGAGMIGAGGSGNGGMVIVSRNNVTIPLTNVGNAQTISVRLNGVTVGEAISDIIIPMRILAGDTTANGSVNSADVSQTKGRIGHVVDATTFRSDVNGNGEINSADISIIKSFVGTGLP
jgi:hypothetical protein